MPKLTEFVERLQHGWNAFVNNKDPTPQAIYYGGYSYRPDRVRMMRGNERSIINSIYTRMAMDAASQKFQHILADKNGLMMKVMDTGLNNILTTEANIDQTSRAFIMDIVLSMFSEGVVAVVPVATDVNPVKAGDNAFDIDSVRTGKIIAWYPEHVKVELYNELAGRKQQVMMPKKITAIMENPFYQIMNEPNSTLQRLIRKLNMLDAIDEQSGSGKLDLIIQLPYTIRSDARKLQAENRRKAIEEQLMGSKYGIAYTDATERITQLNRPVDNNLMKQIEYLTETLMSQLGITNEILNGSASEETMANYYTRLIEPILSTITEEFRRKFLTKRARGKGQTIAFFREPFKMLPPSKFADMADKLVTSEILTPNEVRRVIGYRPSDDPAADELRNRHLNQAKTQETEPQAEQPSTTALGQKATEHFLLEENQNGREV